MAAADRNAMVKGFVRRNPPPKARKLKAFNPAKIQEDDPQGRWNPGLQGNQRWGKSYRGVANYNKGRGRPD